MGYYVKRLSDGRIDGEFPLDEIMQGVILNRLSDSDYIIEARGQSLTQLAWSGDWIPIGEFMAVKPGRRGSEPEESDKKESESTGEGCPHCGEPMLPATIVCKRCGKMLGQEDRKRVYAGQKPRVPESRVAELAKRRAQEAAKLKEAQEANQGPHRKEVSEGSFRSTKWRIFLALGIVALIVILGILVRNVPPLEQGSPQQPSASVSPSPIEVPAIEVPRISDASKVRDNLETTKLEGMKSQIPVSPSSEVSQGGRRVVTWTFKDGSKFIATFVESEYGLICINTDVID